MSFEEGEPYDGPASDFEPTPLLGRGYRKGPSLADRKLEKLGNEDDSWSKSDLRKIKWMRRWRRQKSLLRTLLALLLTKREPKLPFSD